MKEIVEKLIEKADSFEIKDETWEELKNDALKELATKASPDNSHLWNCIKLIAEYMSKYTK